MMVLRRPPQTLEAELREAGYRGDLGEFRDLLLDIKNGLYRNWSDETLTLHPREAIRYCDAVRYHSRLDALDDYLILRILYALRKNNWGDTPSREVA